MAKKVIYCILIGSGKIIVEVFDEFKKWCVEFMFDYFYQDYILCFGQFFEGVCKFVFEVMVQLMDIVVLFFVFYVFSCVFYFLEQFDGFYSIGVYYSSIMVVVVVFEVVFLVVKFLYGRDGDIIKCCYNQGVVIGIDYVRQVLFVDGYRVICFLSGKAEEKQGCGEGQEYIFYIVIVQ